MIKVFPLISAFSQEHRLYRSKQVIHQDKAVGVGVAIGHVDVEPRSIVIEKRTRPRPSVVGLELFGSRFLESTRHFLDVFHHAAGVAVSPNTHSTFGCLLKRWPR